jgi:hypothetical protein
MLNILEKVTFFTRRRCVCLGVRYILDIFIHRYTILYVKQFFSCLLTPFQITNPKVAVACISIPPAHKWAGYTCGRPHKWGFEVIFLSAIYGVPTLRTGMNARVGWQLSGTMFG